MEERKIKEIEYYDKEAKESKDKTKESGSLAGLNPLDLDSYKYLYKLVEKYSKGKKVLDYCCGSGIHLTAVAKVARETIGIDLSQKSLQIAQSRIEKEGLLDKAITIIMDAEHLDFEDNSFDVVFDGGSFSSLDFDKSLPEIKRVLKPGGLLLGIETFGHNPLTNLKRKFNKASGRRTEWAAEHIFRAENLKEAGELFDVIEARYFHLISWIAFPFVKYPGGKILLRILEAVDLIFLFILPFLRKYSFKVVFVFKKPA